MWLAQGHAHNLKCAAAMNSIPWKAIPIVKGIHDIKRKKGKEILLGTKKIFQ